MVDSSLSTDRSANSALKFRLKINKKIIKKVALTKNSKLRKIEKNLHDFVLVKNLILGQKLISSYKYDCEPKLKFGANFGFESKI